MTFVVTLALLIGLLVVVPLFAHLLRRGRPKDIPFPPTHLIPEQESVARRRSHFEDRLLLALRAAMILTIALLGATPLLRCERAALSRRDGASIAAVIVLDDSASMRNLLPSGISRFARAKRAALELAGQIREGDSMGLVLCGKPARMLLLPTSNASLIQQQLSSLQQSDRPTDLVAAIALGESALDRLPHVDRRVILLSDLAGELPKLSPRVSNLLPELSAAPNDCGILSALRNHGRVTVELACTKNQTHLERRLQLVRVKRAREIVQEKTIAMHAGRDSYVLDDGAGHEDSLVILAGNDENAHDDRAPVFDGALGPSIATYSDPVSGRGTTGGPPILEQALLALNPQLSVRPLTTVPDGARELTDVSVLLLDDPPLISAESRAAILTFVERGGTAVALFGPSSDAAQLGSPFLPFIERRASWSDATPSGLDPSSLASLGAAAASLEELSAKGRLIFDESHDANVVVRGRWSDQKPFWIERPIGRGLAITLGLPASIAQSDLALRSGFIALLEQLLSTSTRLGLARVIEVGQPWRFIENAQTGSQVPRVEGPNGPIAISAGDPANRGERVVVPAELGRYSIRFADRVEERLAILPAEEILESPRPWPVAATQKPDKATGRLDLTRPIVIALLALAVLELLLAIAPLRGFLRKTWEAMAARGRFRRSRSTASRPLP